MGTRTSCAASICTRDGKIQVNKEAKDRLRESIRNRYTAEEWRADLEDVELDVFFNEFEDNFLRQPRTPTPIRAYYWQSTLH